MTSGQPVLDESMTAEAEEALDQISADLLRVDPATLGGPAWASGASGLAIVHSHLALRFPDRPHEACAQTLLEGALDWVQSNSIAPWLVGGLAGIGWTVERLAGANAEDEHDPNAGLDDSLRRLLARPKGLPCEFIAGVAGLAVYAMERAHRATGRNLLEAIARRLIDEAHSIDGQRTAWLSMPEWDTFNHHSAPYFNFGVGHGVPGTLAVVSSLVERDILAGELVPLLRRASEWLLAQRLPSGDAWFRSTSDDAGGPTRTAWCYGDPGVAWALMLAARALGDRMLQSEAIAVAVHAAARPVIHTGVTDAGLCHGAAGLGHVFRRMSILHPDRLVFRQAARDWFERALRMRVEGAPFGGFRAHHPEKMVPGSPLVFRDDPGVLTGASGVALAFLSALDESIVGWDAPMMVCAETPTGS
jgi:lantibiotic modifying enzyme